MPAVWISDRYITLVPCKKKGVKMNKIQIGDKVKLNDGSYSSELNFHTGTIFHPGYIVGPPYVVLAIDCRLPMDESAITPHPSPLGGVEGYAKVIYYNDTIIRHVHTGQIFFVTSKFLSVIPKVCETCGKPLDE